MKELDIIDSYRKLPIGKYQEILEAYNDKSLDELNTQVRILSILTDMAEEDILHLPIVEYKTLAMKSRFLETMAADEKHIAKEYICGDYVLVPVSDTRDILTCQYVDFQEYAKGGDKNLPEVLSCLLVPKGKRYTEGYDILDVQKAIRTYLSVSNVISISAFFFASWKQSMAHFLISLRKEAEKIPELERRQMMLQRIQEQEEILSQSGDGLPM